MAKIKKGEEEPKEKREVEREDIRQFQLKIAEYKQQRIDGIIFSRFDQYMRDCGIIKIENGNIVVKDVNAYNWFSKVEEKRKAWEAWQNEKEGTMPVFDLKAIRPEGLIKTSIQ